MGGFMASDPSLMDIIQSTAQFAKQNYLWLKSNYKFPDNTLDDLRECGQRIAPVDYITIALMAIGWTIARNATSSYIFKPFARSCRIKRKDVEKFPESAWKSSYYLFTFLYTVYLLFGQNCCHYFLETHNIWSDYSVDDTVPTNIRLLYLVEISFYIHSIYAVLVLDEWRKDTLVMFSHHIITLTLLSLSLATKAHRVGVIVLLLHDGCDVAMEVTKCLLLFKYKGIVGKLIDGLTAISFITFVGSWIICRLYWFPMKAIYTSSAYFTQQNTQKFPFMLVLYTMLWVILAMDVYWFIFIIKLSVNVITGKSKIEDNREYSVNKSSKSNRNIITTTNNNNTNKYNNNNNNNNQNNKKLVTNNGSVYTRRKLH
ncbi:ceramide synthase 1-like [Oppia nitens]|uniref:ceramide synthase 1-like n=1 Tax=Oppia nitens TaxID=1686743 RepID=UPI0023DAF1A7|nr:ceramide synthase 1-like [Oppia nitens]